MLLAPIALDCTMMVTFAWMVFCALRHPQLRAKWATCAIVVMGVIGISTQIVSLMLHMGWLATEALSRHSVVSGLRCIEGLLLVTIFVLFLSGQFRLTP